MASTSPAGSTGSDGQKFVINFSIEGSGEAQLKEINKSFETIATQLQKGLGPNSMNGLNKGIQEASNHVGGLGEHISEAAEKVFFIGEAFESIGEIGHSVTEMGVKGIETFAKAFETMFEELSPVEQSMVRIMGIGRKTKEEAMHMVHDAADLMGVLPVTESQVANIVTGLVGAKVDMDKVFGKYDELAKKGDAAKEAGEAAVRYGGKYLNVTSTSMITDLAAMTGQLKDMDNFTGLFNKFLLTGHSRHLMGRLPADILKEIEVGVQKGAPDAGQRMMDNLFEVLRKRGAVGAGMLATETFEGIMVKFKDLKMSFARMLGGMPGEGGAYDELKEGLSNLHKIIFQTFNDPAFQKAIRDGFAPIVHFLVEALESLGQAINKVFEFIKDNPQLFKAAMLLGFFGSMALIATGAIITLGAAVGGMIVLFIAVPELLFAVLAGLVAIPVAIVALGTALAGAAIVYKMWQQDLGGIRTFFENIELVIQGVTEAIEYWDGNTTAITEETAEKMERAGISGPFLKLISVLRQVEVFFDEFVDTVKARWIGDVGPEAGRTFEHLEDVGNKLWGALYRLLAAFGLVHESTTAGLAESESSGASWGNTFMNAIDAMILGVDSLLSSFDAIFPSQASLIDSAMTMYTIYADMMLLFDALGVVVRAFWGGFLLVITPVAYTIEAIVNGLQAIAKAADGDFSGAAKALTDFSATKSIFQGGVDSLGDASLAFDNGAARYQGRQRNLETMKKARDAALSGDAVFGNDRLISPDMQGDSFNMTSAGRPDNFSGGYQAPIPAQSPNTLQPINIVIDGKVLGIAMTAYSSEEMNTSMASFQDPVSSTGG